MIGFSSAVEAATPNMASDVKQITVASAAPDLICVLHQLTGRPAPAIGRTTIRSALLCVKLVEYHSYHLYVFHRRTIRVVLGGELDRLARFRLHTLKLTCRAAGACRQ